jgi:3-dehydroquinate dehydratase-1
MRIPAKIAFYFGSQELAVGLAPLVVGTLSSLEARFPAPGRKVCCDVVEVRLDKTGRPEFWMECCKEIQNRGWPVLLTVRLKSEGGSWEGPDEERFDILHEAIGGLAGVDVEWSSKIAHPLAMFAKIRHKVCVISYHNFHKTPPVEELVSIIREAEDIASVVKISTRLNCEEDEETLHSLLGMKWKRPLCVIGMGTAWTHTRVSFPLLGSCLTYGYLDKPTAPGQISAAELTRRLREKMAASVKPKH